MRNRTKKLNPSIIIACILVLFLAGILVSLQGKSEPVSITILPQVPGEGRPLLITFNLNNPSDEEKTMGYEFYIDGVLLLQGNEVLPRDSTKKYTYVYPGPQRLGERITFLVKTESEQESYEKTLSMPSYPPQVWSSFVSFASFSTTLIGSSMSSSLSTSITSMEYYDSSLGDTSKPNVGLIFSIVLIVLLIYLEITQPFKEKSFPIIYGLRIRLSRLSMILLIVFLGIVFTKVAMMISG